MRPPDGPRNTPQTEPECARVTETQRDRDRGKMREIEWKRDTEGQREREGDGRFLEDSGASQGSESPPNVACLFDSAK